MPIKIFLICIATLMSASVWAQIPGTFRNVFYEGSAVTIEERILGRNCFSLESSPLGLSCNPSHMAREERSVFRFNVLGDKALKGVLVLREDVASDDTYKLVNDINNQRGEPLSSEFSSSLWFQQDWWAVAYTPLRVGAATYVRNPTVDQVTMSVARESELSLRGGFFFSEDKNLRLGANLRFVQSDFIRQQFDLIDALADPSIVDIQSQKTVYFDPAMTYSWESAWDPELSLMITDVPIYKKGESKDIKSTIEVGYSTRPNFLDKKLRTSFHLTTRNDIYELRDRVRWGGIYEMFDGGAVSFSLSGNDYSFGFLGRLNYFTYGLGYKSEVLNLNGENLARVSTTLLELGLTF